MKRLQRALAWFRFQGWRNVYWRENWYLSKIEHGRLVPTPDQARRILEATS